ncbi:tandem-95 repeat protein, partial [Polynucleobacter sp. AP-Capit-er-40B-B4]|uniref:tandem-95 repeat protein n=1 Tax=Polynucleobacter sp. AP-Capit-er-40B-B4 TaxID=2576927 RepID=UPI001C0B26A6
SIVYTATVASAVAGSDLVVTLSNGTVITIPVGQTTANSAPVAVRTDEGYIQGTDTLAPVTISAATQTANTTGNFEALTTTGTVNNTVVDDADPMTVILSSATAGAAITEGGSIVYTATVASAVAGSDLVVTLSNGTVITIPVGQTTANSAPVAVGIYNPLVSSANTLTAVSINTAVQTAGRVGNYEALNPIGLVNNTIAPSPYAFVDTNESVSTPEDTSISGNVIDTGLTSVNGPITLTGFAVDINNDGSLETFVAGHSATIAGVGAITINANGTYTFTPVANWNGTVPTVTYYLSDNAGATVGDSSTLSIVVNPVNDSFIDGNESVITAEDIPISGNIIDAGLTSGDGPISVAGFIVDGIVDSNNHLVTFSPGDTVNISGVGTLTIAANGSYTFTPAVNWNGIVPTVHYSLADTYGAEEISTLDIVVTPVNDPPIDGNEVVVIEKDTSLSVPVNSGLLANASDADADNLTITSYSIAGITGAQAVGNPVAIAGVGLVTINSNGSYSFTPETGYTGAVPVITYTVSDSHGVTDTSTLRITIPEVPIVVVQAPPIVVLQASPVEGKPKTPDIPPAALTPTKLIALPPYLQKPVEHPPIQMGRYEFNTVILDFNGAHGGINQFGLPHVDSTGTRGSLSYSNVTPYTSYDRVTDEVENAQRTINANAIFSKPSDSELHNPVMPPDAKVDADGKGTYVLPPATFVGGKGDIKLTAYTKDGKPLPDWIKFNPVNGKFEINMPKDVKEPVEVQVIGTDSKGDQAKTKLNIKPPVGKVQKAAFIGKSSLSSQIKSAMTFGRG